MGQSWSNIRKRLEQDLLCEKLRGRVQYFNTNYHGAPDNYGRFAVRVDGEELVRAHDYTDLSVDRYVWKIKDERSIPEREWICRGGVEYLYDEENTAAEEEGRIQAANDGILSAYDFPWLIQKYLNQPIEDSLNDEEPVVRMFAILDRRVGKRRLIEIAERIHEQPEWLQPIYRLRLDAEGIRSSFDIPGMKRVVLSHDGPLNVYLVPEEVEENLEEYCLEFCGKWIHKDENAKKFKVQGGVCYGSDDFIDYLNEHIFPDKKSIFVEAIEVESDVWDEPWPKTYHGMKWFNF